MSRTALGWMVAAAVLAAGGSGGETARAAGDALPHALPAVGASAHAAPARWLVAARPATATRRIATWHAALPLRLPGAYSIAAGDARAFAAALRRAGTLRYSEPDVAPRRASTFEAPGSDPTWTRGAVVAPGLTPPPAFAPIGMVDDVVDTRVADVGQARVLASSPTQTLDPTGPAYTAHGTEVASVAAARADGAGVIGIAPGAPVLSYGYKVYANPDDGPTCAEVVDGVIALADAGAKVINLSLESPGGCHTLQLAIGAAFGDGAVVVASSGNEGRVGSPTVYPAAYPHVVTVGALDTGLARAPFSNKGAALDLAAPGSAVPVAVPAPMDTDGTADGLTRVSGTSFAAPIVSGVASWLIAARPKLSAGQYADLLRAGAKDLSRPGWDASTGFGLVDLAAALAAPVPAADRGEPDDGIDFVDGSAFSKPDPYVSGTVKASVTAVEDPADVRRVRLRAGGTATVRLTPAAGTAADLYAYTARATSLAATPLTRSRRTGTKTDRITIRNRVGRAATFYVAVRVPPSAGRALGGRYVLRIARG